MMNVRWRDMQIAYLFCYSENIAKDILNGKVAKRGAVNAVDNSDFAEDTISIWYNEDKKQ